LEIPGDLWKGRWKLVSKISRSVQSVQERVRAAAERAGRDPDSVTLIGVSKTRTPEEIRAAIKAGVVHLGENKVQELATKVEALGRTGLTWHLIGSLQTNKVKAALSLADLIHGLDRDSLLEALAKEAERRGAPVRALVQVNVSGEATKHGIAPAELLPFLRRVSERGWVEIEGLMTMAPASADPETARPHFRRLRELAQEAAALGLPRVRMQTLSMGMSGDFEVAIEEGATHVRVGTALFGERDYT
jgi:pyridoxal phosphate enzyme (YggS family)